MAALKTALNLALKDGYLTSNHAWLNALKPVANASRKRTTYLDLAQRRALIENAPSDLAHLIRALSLTPLRPGAMAALTVSSYDKRLKTLNIGKDKAGADRILPLPAETAAFFSEQCKDKLPSAPLLCRQDGKKWDKDAWKYVIKTALAKANLPTEATIYTLRHSVITDLVVGGLDILTVAKLSGTSVAMIEKHYGHLRQEHAKTALARLAL